VLVEPPVLFVPPLLEPPVVPPAAPVAPAPVPSLVSLPLLLPQPKPTRETRISAQRRERFDMGRHLSERNSIDGDRWAEG
jgi:hypothetical protein